MAKNYNERRWMVPSKRATGYASERQAKVHQRGADEGKQLTDYELGLRSGYLLCQSDHTGIYKYKEAIKAGKSKTEARRISRMKGKKSAYHSAQAYCLWGCLRPWTRGKRGTAVYT